MLRAAVDGDFPFIHSSWKNSYRRTMAELPKGVYFAMMGRRIDRLLGRGMRIAVKTWDEDPDYIAGWVAFGPAAGVVHYVYVRDLERRRGTARELVEAALAEAGSAVVYATHWTPVVEAIAARHRGVRYAPSKMEKRA